MKTTDLEKFLVGNRVLARAIDNNKVYEDSGVIEKKNVNNNFIYAEVVMTGPGMIHGQAVPPREDPMKTYEEQIKEMYIPLSCQAGDRIFFLPNAGTQIWLDGAIHYLLTEEHVMLGLRD